MSSKPRIVVVGAGAVGLSTAVQIQEASSGAVITLVAENLNQDTTSDGAAGVFFPTMSPPEGTSKELLFRWASDSFDFFKELFTSKEAPEAGISHVTGYGFYRNDAYVEDPLVERVFFDFRPCNDKERSLFPAVDKKTTCARFISTLMIEGRWFLPFLLKKFCSNGGQVEQRRVESLEELAGRYDVAVICTGLGSRDLLGDKEVVPVRGQVIRVKAPWIKTFLFNDCYRSYIIPGKETCVIGGTAEYGNENLKVCEEDTKRIWKDACNLLPSLAEAEWKWEWVGLRPTRKSIRVERETKHLKGGKLELVYNYGHGGNGLGLSWGTAKHASELVTAAVKDLLGH